MSNHSNISIFVPHIGCSHRCSFCDQNSITGQTTPADTNSVVSAVETAMNSPKYSANNTEIAFFGGSFTAIEREYMISLLETAYKYVKSGVVSGIRISTRPDAIDEEVLTVLKRYGVTAIELGAQSTSQRVLDANKRGHTKEDIFVAGNLIKKHGFSLGLQMMTGLYMSTDADDYNTATDFCSLKPDTVRIYPTIVLKNTYLSSLYERNLYFPQRLDDAVKLAVRLIALFESENIDIIRLGLHTINADSYVAGPWHPSFSELCSNEIYYNKFLKALTEKGKYSIFVPPKDISKAVGQNKSNLYKLSKLGFTCKVLPDASLSERNIKIVKDV